MVDNCYGEFVEEKEPTAVGADLCIGSLIKNPGGGMAEIILVIFTFFVSIFVKKLYFLLLVLRTAKSKAMA